MFKVNASDPETGKTYKLEVPDPRARELIGMRIRDKFKGELIGLPGYELEITGGTDKDGFPMRPDVYGSGRARVLLSGGPGFQPRERGQRKRKLVRGTQISDAIVQINAKIVKRGKKSIEEFFPKEEAKKEAKLD